MTETSDQPYRSKGPEDHPSPEKLAAYFENELSPTEDDAIQEHLATCDLCAQALLDLKKFLKTPAEPIRPGVADLEVASEWRDLRKRIEEDRKRGQEPVSAPAPRPGFLGSVKTAYSLAAVFAAAALGLSLYAYSLRQELRAFDRNPHIIFLTSATVRSADNKAKTLELPPGELGRILLTLGLPKGKSDPEYRVEIQRTGGGPIFEERGLKPQEGEIRFLVSPELFESGRYEIKLWGTQPPNPVNRYELEVIRK